jgi:DNA modification methylase
MQTLSDEIIMNDHAGQEIWEVPHRMNSRYLSHDYFRYIGKFPPQLPREFIRRYAKKGGLIVDPMCGGGTVLIEAKIAGYDAVGFDINPVSVLVSQTVVAAIEPSVLDRRVRQFIANAGNGMLGTAFMNASNGKERSRVPDLFGNEIYYHPQNLEELSILKNQIDVVDDPTVKNFLTVAFLSIMRQVSQANVKKMNTEIDENKPRRDVWTTFYKKLKQMVEVNASLWELPKPDIRVELNNALSIPLEDGAASLVIIHPPYLTNTAFSEAVQLQLAWLGIKHTDVWKKELRYRGSYLREPDGLQKYLIGWNEVLKETFRILEKGGKCVVVVGDGQINYVRIPIGAITEEFARDIGYDVVDSIRHHINNNTGMTQNRKMRDQHIIVLGRN